MGLNDWHLPQKQVPRRFIILRHEHLLRFIARSHSIVLVQTKERVERMWLDWDRGNTIFTLSAKSEVESLRPAGRSFIYDRNSNGPMAESLGPTLRQGALSERTPLILTSDDRPYR